MAQLTRILIADDSARSRSGIRALLTTCPEVEVVGEAVDGREALHQVAESRPDVVLMDARMPLMDGLEATRLIKNKWPEVRVVMLTLYNAYQARALSAGADAFLIKGCPNEELLTAITNDKESQSTSD